MLIIWETKDFIWKWLSHKNNRSQDKRKTASSVFHFWFFLFSLKLSELIVNTGGIEALIGFVKTAKSNARVPGIVALGYMAGHSSQSAIIIASSSGVYQLSLIMNEESDHQTLATAIWALGQIAKHSQEHAGAVAAANVFPRLLQVLLQLFFMCKHLIARLWHPRTEWFRSKCDGSL